MVALLFLPLPLKQHGKRLTVQTARVQKCCRAPLIISSNKIWPQKHTSSGLQHTKVLTIISELLMVQNSRITLRIKNPKPGTQYRSVRSYCQLVYTLQKRTKR